MMRIVIDDNDLLCHAGAGAGRRRSGQLVVNGRCSDTATVEETAHTLYARALDGEALVPSLTPPTPSRRNGEGPESLGDGC